MEQNTYAGIAPPPLRNDDNIMRRRWESEELIDSLYLLLAGYERIHEEGKVKLRARDDVPSIMNKEGAGRVITVVRSFINPVVSLSRLSDEDARQLFYNCYNSVMEAVVLNAKEWGMTDENGNIKDADLEIVKATIQPLIFSQIMRSVDGWEAKNAKTDYLEQTGNQRTVSESRDGFRLPRFGGK
jgi:hypothetical protein